MEDVVYCEAGHKFVLGAPGHEFTPDEDVIAGISWCPEMVAKDKHAGLVMECGERIVWRRLKAPKEAGGLDKQPAV